MGRAGQRFSNVVDIDSKFLINPCRSNWYPPCMVCSPIDLRYNLFKNVFVMSWLLCFCVQSTVLSWSVWSVYSPLTCFFVQATTWSTCFLYSSLRDPKCFLEATKWPYMFLRGHYVTYMFVWFFTGHYETGFLCKFDCGDRHVFFVQATTWRTCTTRATVPGSTATTAPSPRQRNRSVASHYNHI